MKLSILEGDRLVFETDLTAPVELGRQRPDAEPEPYCLLPATAQGPARLILARKDETVNYPRQFALLEPLPGGDVRLTNPHERLFLSPPGQAALPPRGHAELTPPFSLRLGSRTVTVAAEVFRLDEQTLSPGGGTMAPPGRRALPFLPPGQFDQLIGWLQSTMGVLQSAVGSDGFLGKAARALVEIVGLHSGRALLLAGGDWSEADAHGVGPADRGASTHILEAVRRERRTIWERREPGAVSLEHSLTGLSIVVASPLLDAAGTVVGCLYGELRREGAAPTRGAGKLEALLVELLANGVSAGLARRRAERDRAVFRQFFPAKLADRLLARPDLLAGKEAKVTVLFCDVRGFSKVSEMLGAEMMVAWINDVMRELSECVVRQEGVLVDYVGDELMAMWGAPDAQPDQATRALRAALDMLQACRRLDAKWRDRLQLPTQVGIGVNTGEALVGNTGSSLKFKYGPLGDMVNVASRTQGLCKYLQCPLLVTGATRAELGDELIARRVVKSRMVNISKERDLYEVAPAEAARREFFLHSERALDTLDKQRKFAEAARLAGTLLGEPANAGDGPLRLVLLRATRALVEGEESFQEVWEPPNK